MADSSSAEVEKKKPEDKEYEPETALDDESSLAKEESKPQVDAKVRGSCTRVHM